MPRIGRRSASAVLVVLATALIVGSGAFSAIAVDRTATISVDGDENALLGIARHTQADPAHFGSGDTLSIQVGAGSTTIEPLFNVTNRGSQTVSVWIEDHDYPDSGSSGFPGDVIGGNDVDNTANITFHNPTYGGNVSCENGVKSIETQGNAVALDPGETLVVSMRSVINNQDEADLLDELTIHADARVPGVSSPTGPCP